MARSTTIVAAAVILGSCTEPAVSSLMLAPEKPDKSLQIKDWYSCAKLVSATTWECEYTGSTTTWIAASWDFPSPPQYTSLMEVKVAESTCPGCPGDTQTDYGPPAYLYPPGSDDAPQKPSRPNCNPANIPNLDEKDVAWCQAPVPQNDQRRKLLQALDAMTAMGGVCATIAAVGRSVFDQGALRVYTPKSTGYKGGGFGSANLGTSGYIVINRLYTDGLYDSGRYKKFTTTLPDGTPVTVNVNLQYIVAHEIDHLMSSDDHLDPAPKGGQGWLTPHAAACSGIAGSP
jgi:hypothetical protein